MQRQKRFLASIAALDIVSNLKKRDLSDPGPIIIYLGKKGLESYTIDSPIDGHRITISQPKAMDEKLREYINALVDDLPSEKLNVFPLGIKGTCLVGFFITKKDYSRCFWLSIGRDKPMPSNEFMKWANSLKSVQYIESTVKSMLRDKLLSLKGVA